MFFRFFLSLYCLVYLRIQLYKNELTTQNVNPSNHNLSKGSVVARGLTEGDTEIEISYNLIFHYYRTYPTEVSGSIFINNKEYPVASISSDQSIFKRLKQKNSGFVDCASYSGEDSRSPNLVANVIIKKKKPKYWRFFLLGDSEEYNGVFLAPTTSREEAKAVYNIFTDLFKKIGE